MPNRLDKQTYSQIIASRPAWRAGLRAFGLLPSAPSPAWSAGRPRPATTVRAEYELTSSQDDTKQHRPATTVRAEYELTSSQADTKQHKIKNNKIL